MIEIHEYNTSQLYNKTLKPIKNALDKHGVPIHEVLTLKENNKSIFVNRDKNASKNMLTILKHYLEKQEYPIEFTKKISKVDQETRNGFKSNLPRCNLELKLHHGSL